MTNIIHFVVFIGNSLAVAVGVFVWYVYICGGKKHD